MFSPGELEGEVDHAFFDSDCEDGKGEDCDKVADKLTTKLNIQPKPDDNRSDDVTKKYSGSVNNNVDEDESEEGVKCSDLKTKKANNNETSWRGSSVSSEDNRDTESTSSFADRESRAGSVTPGDAHSVSSEEPDDTVTDVSPLSSPASSPLQSLDLSYRETEGESVEQQSVPSSGLSSAEHHEGFSQQEDDYSLSSASRLDGHVVIQFPGSRHRKNYSFTNSEVQRIDRENQRLLHQLSRCSSSRAGSAPGQRRNVTSSTPLNHVSHSGLNRLREQQRIERDNLAFLKRLESIKPTPGMKRSEQLADYQRQVGYLNTRPAYQTTVKKSFSKLSSAGKDHVHSKGPHHSARPTSTATELSSTAVPQTRELKAGPQAWS